MDFLKPHSLIFCSKLVDLEIAISTELEKLDLEFEHSIVCVLEKVDPFTEDCSIGTKKMSWVCVERRACFHTDSLGLLSTRLLVSGF